MKKLSFLFSLFILLTAFTCENEPLEGDFTTEDELSCEIAAQNTQDAAIAFLDVTDENYTQLCIAYRNALEVQIEFCGDPDGILQIQINSLGSCSSDNQPDDCASAMAAANTAEEAFNVSNDINYEQLCNAYQLALENQIDLCGDDDGALQAEIDGLDNCTTDVTNPPSSYALMTANIIGEQFDYLVPFLYQLFGNAVGIVTYAQDNDNEKFLRIQGNSTPTEFTDFTKEINLFIPESLWSEGTYVLDNDAFDENMIPTCNYNIIYNDGDGSSQAYEPDNGGTITITEFNLQDRVIRGTFEFSFTRYFVDTGLETGPFECLDGTFDYSLDDSYFD